MQAIPLYLSFAFGLITLLSVALFYKASNYSKTTLLLVTGWLLLQALLGRSNFYTTIASVPPRLLFALLPPLLFIAVLFSTTGGRKYLDRLNLKTLVLIHFIRVPVEFVLFGLFVYKVVPKIMTFEGHNFDVLSGLSAPLVYYFGFMKKRIGRTGLLFWNFACLALLINIVGTAVLSAPFPFQKFGFDQPNIAILYFPFVWLPACVVPLVLLSHLASIRQLILKKKTNVNYIDAKSETVQLPAMPVHG